jgi:hypothetical protein
MIKQCSNLALNLLQPLSEHADSVLFYEWTKWSYLLDQSPSTAACYVLLHASTEPDARSGGQLHPLGFHVLAAPTTGALRLVVPGPTQTGLMQIPAFHGEAGTLAVLAADGALGSPPGTALHFLAGLLPGLESPPVTDTEQVTLSRCVIAALGAATR